MISKKPEAIHWQSKYPLSCVSGMYAEFNTGWNKLVCDMFDKIEPALDQIYKLEPIKSQDLENRFVIGQIKEKFAGLRVYVDFPYFWKEKYQVQCDAIQEAINTAESISTETCEICGDDGKAVGTAWLSCRCAKCGVYKLFEPEDKDDGDTHP